MKDDLDRVLEGLGTVEAPPGLEGRVLRAMEAPVRGRSFAWAWMAAAALILVGVLVGGVAMSWHGRTVGSADNPPVAMEPQGMGHPVVVDAQGPVGFRGGPTHRVKQRRDEWGTQDVVVRETTATVSDAGFPAPEEPLSEQELLLLKLAQRPTPRTLAVFNVKLREQRAAVAKAEFDEFFKPVVVANEPDPDLHVAHPAGIEEKKDEALAQKR